MKYISHRGNLNGRIESHENHPEYIEAAINAGYDVEIDLRMKDGMMYLGHDVPQYHVSDGWLLAKAKHLWIHTKDFESLNFMLGDSMNRCNFFAHTADPFVSISHPLNRSTKMKLIWLHELEQPCSIQHCIVPLLDLESVRHSKLKYNDVYGVCSDYVVECKKKWPKEIKSSKK